MSIDLLFRLDNKGVIEHTYFLNWAEVATEPKSIHSLLDETESERLNEALTLEKETVFKKLSIKNRSFFVLVVPLGNQYLMFASDFSPSEESVQSYKHILRSMVDIYDNPHHDGEDMTKFHYESMQKLNNNLLNKTREIERLNKKLNRANKLLNNRLVKDPLTGLTSRYQYADEMERMVREKEDLFGIFCFIDIDDFKSVNDTYGHKTGDVYLKKFAQRLKKLPFDPSIIMRIAGDEFGVFIADVKTVDTAIFKDIWKQFEKRVSGSVSIDGKKLPLKYSVGMAVYNKHTRDIHELIDMADQAMYEAKTSGNTYKVYKKKG